MSLVTRLLRPRPVSAGRTLVGVSMLARPTALPVLLGVDPQACASTAWVVQMLGAREVALGLGGLVKGDSAWLAAGVLCDATDAAALLLAVRAGTVGSKAGGAVVAVAGLATLSGLSGLVNGRSRREVAV